MKKFLITGGAGFVGAALVRKLIENKNEVHVLIKQSTSLWRLEDVLQNPLLHLHVDDLSDLKKLTKLIGTIQPAIVYHLAARGAYPTQNDPQDIFQSNLFSLLNLFQALNSTPYQLFVNVGSSSEYGLQDKPMSELMTTPRPNSYYAISKLAATNLSQLQAVTSSKPIVTVRLFSVYGPYEEAARLIPTVVKKFHADVPISVTEPPTVRDFIYVDDVVDFFLNTEELSKYSGEIFNVGSGKEISITELMKIAEQALQKKAILDKKVYPARSWDALHWQADMSHTFQLLSWRPKINLEQGLQKTDEWFKTHLSLWE